MAIAPYVFDRVEAHFTSNSFDFSSTTVGIFVQRLESFTACGNVRIILSLDDFVELEPFGHIPVPAAPVAARASRRTPGEEDEPVFVHDERPMSGPPRSTFVISSLVAPSARTRSSPRFSARVCVVLCALNPAGGQFQISVVALKNWSVQFGIDNVGMLGTLLANKLIIRSTQSPSRSPAATRTSRSSSRMGFMPVTARRGDGSKFVP